MPKEKEIAIKSYSLSDPAQVVKMADTLKEYVVKQKLYTDIRGKNYAHVEGWQFAGFLAGLSPRVESVENLSTNTEIKWKATVNIYSQQEKLMGVGIALCSSKETSKKNFDEYAILSMAQTRAIGKAYRNLIGWVMKLAGYESTPKEEMTKVDSVDQEPVIQVGEDFKNAKTCAVCDEVLTSQVAEYSKKMYGKYLCRKDQKSAKRK